MPDSRRYAMEKAGLCPRLIAAWCLILLAGTAFLFAGITDEGLWFDESYTGCLVNHSMGQIIAVTGSDNHPPLYYLMLRLFILVFGNTVLTLRAFSVLGVLALAAWGMGPVRRIAGVRAGMLYTILIFITPITLDMGQEARMYTWASFFVTGSALYGYLAYQDGRRRDWIRFVLCSLAAAYTHYYALLAVMILCGLLLLGTLAAGKRLLPFLPAAGCIAAGYLPWLTKLIPQIGRVSSHFWISPLTGESLLLVLIYPYSSKFSEPLSSMLTGIAYFLAVYYIAGGIAHAIKDNGFKLNMPIIAFCAYLLTILAGALASWIIRPVLVERYMMPVFGLFILGVAYGLSSLKGGLRASATGALILALLAIPQIYATRVTPANGPMKEAQAALAQEIQPEDVFLHTDEHTFGTFCYYFPDNRHYYYQRKGYEGYSNYDAFKPMGMTIDSMDELNGASRIWLVQRAGAGDNISVNEWLSNGSLIADTPFTYYQLPTSWYAFSVCRATPGDPKAIAASAFRRDRVEKLTIRAGSFKNDNGKALIILYNHDPMNGPGVFYQSLDITGGEVEAVFYNIPYGEYAALVIHDENLNQMMDLSGDCPLEGLGASNQDQPLSGFPVFDACRFQYGSELNEIYIPVFYY